MEKRDDYIAVFDSGVGGLSVLAQLRRLMPRDRFYYFGDSANAPYGTRTPEEVRRLTFAVVEWIFRERPCKALVVACNTATAAAVRQLREKYPEKIIVGIEPALKLAADHFPGGRVGVMATPLTLREEKFDHLLHRIDSGCRVVKIPAPGLVELIEAGKTDTPETERLLRELLAPYAGALDALVLGCTHNPIAAAVIARVLGPEVELLDGGPGTARETRRRLEEKGLLSQGPGEIVITNSHGGQEKTVLCRKLLNMLL